MKKIVIIDNYDSFTYNLVQIVEDIVGHPIDIIRNDKFQIEDLVKYEYIILSPGPGVPSEAGLLKPVISEYGPSKKILGVCLGLQAIGEVYGAKLKNLNKVYHGMKTDITKTEYKSPLFEGISDDFSAGRYHSWVIDRESDLSELNVTARDKNGQIMAADHKTFDIYGVQFHPESIMTPEGKKMIANFLNL